jgi:hypothetical protein
MQLEAEIPDVDMAIQFLYTVAASNADVDRRPKANPTAKDIHTYTLQTAIRDCAKADRDAGILCLNKKSITTNHCSII